MKPDLRNPFDDPALRHPDLTLGAIDHDAPRREAAVHLASLPAHYRAQLEREWNDAAGMNGVHALQRYVAERGIELGRDQSDA